MTLTVALAILAGLVLFAVVVHSAWSARREQPRLAQQPVPAVEPTLRTEPTLGDVDAAGEPVEALDEPRPLPPMAPRRQANPR
jgi:FtsZ-interacting cell division protein ZipA